MAQFISLSSLSAYYSSPSDLMNPEGYAEFLGKLDGEERARLCRVQGWNPAELQALLDKLGSAQYVLFYSWVMQSPALEDLLTKGTLREFEDRGGHLTHQFAGAYCDFLSPFLAPVLLRFAGNNLAQTQKAFTFVCLLSHDHTAVVETQLFAEIRGQVKSAEQEMNSHATESDLLAVLQQLCAEEVLYCVNHLSRPMYATRLEYVDILLNFLRAKACSVRLANWLLKRLELIRLNKEHQYKIEDLRKALATGQLQVKNTLEKRRSRLPLGRILLFTFLALAVVSVVYVVKYKPFSEVDVVAPSDETSFEQFSVDERKRIDSLLQEMDGTRHADDFYDAGAIFPQGTALSLRKAFFNESLERISEDFALDAQLQAQGYADSCKKGVDFHTLEGTANLAQYKGSMEAMFRNESAYDAIVLVANNRKGGSVYSGFVRRGEVLTARVEVDDILLVIVGNTFRAYKRPSGVPPTEMPSSAFTYHFCNTDFNYPETIYTPYVVSRKNGGKCKFLIDGDKGDYVNFVDVYDVLEPW